ncbi:MAG: serine protease [Fibrobacter sp.]|nr:serine protease [Fibrobacter sp.]
MKFFWSLLLLTISFSSVASDTDSSKSFPAKPVVIVIPVEGTVDPGMAAFVSRALRDSRKYTDKIVVFELDSYGGQVDAAFQIVDTILSVEDSTISYVKTKAISAGALIALAGNRLVMKNATTIGDVAPLTMSNDGPQMLGEKYQSPIRAKFRTLAKRNGYPEALTESMVTAEMIVYEVQFKDTTIYMDSTGFSDLDPARKKQVISKKTVVDKGELLTMDDVEAKALGFSKMSVSSLKEMLLKLGYGDREVIRIQQNWSEALVRFIGVIAPILIMIGFSALYIEIRTPGFGVPGIIGIICLGTVFIGQYMVGLADYTELLLMAIGAVLLAVEIFVLPGFGVAGFAGIAFMMLGIILSFQDFVIPKPEFPWQGRLLIKNIMMVVGSFTGAIVVALFFFRYALPHIGKIVSGPYLKENLSDARADAAKEAAVLFPGDRGEAITALRPSGKALIKGETWDVISEGEFVDKGSTIVIREVSGNRIMVYREQT